MLTVLTSSRSAPVDPRLEELVARLGVVAGACAYLEELRWPDGVTCARCGSLRVTFLEARCKHACVDCRYQFRVTAGTVLHDSHVPAHKWLVAVGLMLSSPEGFPANQLYARIGGSYKTSWFVEHRVRAAMAQALRGGRDSRTTPRAGGFGPRAAGAAYHRPSLEHLEAYRAETRWRADHVDAENAFRSTVLALLDATPVSYRKLTRRARRPIPALAS
jgi:hypothetical protein